MLIVLTACQGCRGAKWPNAQTPEDTAINGFANTNRFLLKQGDGYILIPTIDSDYVYYWDINENVCVPLCNKPDCDHLNRQCNAYVPDAQPYSLQFYEGKYCIWTSGVSPRLYAVEPDGSGSTLIMLSPTGGIVRESYIINDRAYLHVAFAQDKNGSDVDGLYRVDMNGKEEPLLIAMNNDDTDWREHRMQDVFYEDGKVYYQIMEYNPGQCRSRVFCYDEETGTVRLLLECPHDISYVVTDGEILYSVNDVEPAELYKRNFDDTTEVRINHEGGYLSADSDYYYIMSLSDNPVMCWVLDRQFREVDCFREEAPDYIDFIARGTTDSSLCFYYNIYQNTIPDEFHRNYQTYYHVYSKDQIGKEQHTCHELFMETVPAQSRIN